MDNISSQIGNRIREYRKRSGLTQEALANNSGINASFLGDIERNLKKPSIETLEKILTALNVSFKDFFDFESDIKPFKECTALEKLNIELQNRSNRDIEKIYSIVKQVLTFSDTE